MKQMKYGTADILFDESWWQFPPFESLLIGTGYNVSGYSDYAVSEIQHSDVGYINELWKTGIIGSLVLYYSFYYLLKNAFIDMKDKEYKSLFIFLGIAIIIFLVKGAIYTYNTGITIIYTLSLMPIYNNTKKKEGNI